jgi:multisubunit Na+/H+ antiporter MnhE subunit
MLWLEAGVILFNCLLTTGYASLKGNITSGEMVLGAILLVNIAAYLFYNLRWDNADGRFLFPSLGAILVFFCVPLYRLSESLQLQRLVVPLLVAEALFPNLLLLLVR